MIAMTVIAVPFSAGFAQTGESSADAGSEDGSESSIEVIEESAAPTVEVSDSEGIEYDPRFVTDNLWIMIAGMLVFIMHLGFATLESGLTRSKNTVNILFKNTMIVCIGLLTYGIAGFNLMYPGFDTDPVVGEDGVANYADTGFFGFAGFDFLAKGTVETDDASLMTAEYGLAMTTYTDFFFQAMVS